jgi:hypothetical protein
MRRIVARPLQIPGKGIRPPDKKPGSKCPCCGKSFFFPKLRINPETMKVEMICPHCDRKLF